MILLHHLGCSPQLTHSTADSFLYQSHSLCEGRNYLIFGSGTKLYVTGKNKHFFSFSCFIVEVKMCLKSVSAASGFTC